jgi:hypothetical protein
MEIVKKKKSSPRPRLTFKKFSLKSIKSSEGEIYWHAEVFTRKQQMQQSIKSSHAADNDGQK